ncbi:type IV toxin-antitoxin system AbiEi family antitoxin [Shewanella intestini]|uniref:Type IV toxin-antitoxin system AbiEi family antitoxin domain-containing protein n=1 Tax=Shewanella intestini TaxID=2017544 RepID=A0ABS5I270_9GAMM|nr:MULTISPECIES: type IV toxin-antitoxin system AbiEi family antitoxin domain-containing protein [Shewanella]MBR9727495.1 type IV toxin-antitoxin system AbiEi family antitoxin domain-containing protein [Shewanella intestini]MRG35355.1 hypothetical protein [Shewanella sp. XMDDZSB0408]
MSLLKAFSDKMVFAKKHGHSGLFTMHDLSLMLNVKLDANFRNRISRACKSGVLERVANGIYVSPYALPDSTGVLEKLAMLLRWDHFNYISLESELSYQGIISQTMFNYLTVMTTGRSATFETMYGTIEFVHTKKNLDNIHDSLYYDHGNGMFRANRKRATSDLRKVGRNLDMIN